jgi:hypothetical protein
MLIETMPEVLQWRNGDVVLMRVHDAYVALLSDALGELAGDAIRTNPAEGEAFLACLRESSDAALLRVLTAPEVSARLLWPSEFDRDEARGFVRDAFEAERLRDSGGADPPGKSLWTAIGDLCFSPDGSRREMPRVDGLAPLDLGSPHAKRVDLSGADRSELPDRPDLSQGRERELILRLEQVRDGLQATGARVAGFAAHFNKVLVLQPDPEAPRQFSSGSNGQFIGRSFLANPLATGVDAELIADAIVHEGIHALLYMQERQRKWVSDPGLYEAVARVTSPWSGRPLPVRPYLQACFVWYGLLHFWCQALEAGAFEQDRVQEQIMAALRGFVGEPLRDRVEPWAGDISVDILEAIAEMQSNVSAAFVSLR